MDFEDPTDSHYTSSSLITVIMRIKLGLRHVVDAGENL